MSGDPRYNGRALDPGELRERIEGTRGRSTVDVEGPARRAGAGTGRRAAPGPVTRGRVVLLVTAAVAVVVAVAARNGRRR
ncbi:hypothetical protein F0L17_24860 [Streptomyces sp. TRM43335]|uniref:Uncharacterized protein n=1 Tax=Streptomyces taklimakanensis TaxID=2569853 RepID=A0A6G2BJ83_9ACTN|nr:hypothetical protein [Streptomyces taklimakanensis]MTE22274.1 hypothetical protein [Streptomyces taklimakanensis]